MAQKDYYRVLGIERNATPSEIKMAYKKMAKKWHPDLNKDEHAAETFKELSQAYSVLSDPQKKQMYDQYGSEAFTQGFQGFNGGDFDFSDLFRGSGFGNMEELFRQAFGGNFGFGGMSGFQKKQSIPQNIRMDIELTFEEAVLGTSKKIEVERHIVCEECNGSGSKNGKKEVCPTCNGKGMETKTRRTPFGIFQTTTTCSSCGGNGEIVTNPCTNCEGDGIVLKKNTIEVTIPEGIDNGNHLRIAKQGHSTPDGRKGDLFIVIHVNPSKLFKRDGSDIFVEHTISYPEAVLGGEISVPILGGKTATITIPAGTSIGKIFRLKGKGIKHVNGNTYGDEYVQAAIDIPTKPSKKEKELLEELLKLQGKEATHSKKRKKGFLEF